MTNPIALDNGNDTIVIDATKPDARSTMLASASAIASIVIDTEGKLTESAKAWGHSLFRAVRGDGLSMDDMIGDSKLAAGWATLAISDGGKKAKARLEVYFSNARLVNENWSQFDDAKREAILHGETSIHYLAGQLRETAKKAATEAKKEAKRVADAAKAPTEGTTEQTSDTTSGPVSSMGVLESLALEVATMPDEAFSDEFAAAFEAMVAAYNARINAIADMVAPLDMAANG